MLASSTTSKKDNEGDRDCSGVVVYVDIYASHAKWLRGKTTDYHSVLLGAHHGTALQSPSSTGSSHAVVDKACPANER